jgi:hypothetical protein
MSTAVPTAQSGASQQAVIDAALLLLERTGLLGTDRHLPWARTQQVSIRWLRHTTLTWVERNFGYAVARAYAGHTDAMAWPSATSRRSAPDGILDLRSGLLEVALGPVGPAFGPQAAAAGEAADHPLGAALDRFGLMRDLLGDTHGVLPSI